MGFGLRQCVEWFSGKRGMPLLGIDIGPTGIRIIELSRRGDNWRVEHFAHQPLSQNAFRDGSIVNHGQVTDALDSAIRQSGSRLRHAALALPSAQVIKKTLTFPDDLSDVELELQLEADAGQSLPFALEELSLDFSVIGPSSVEPGNIEVMLVAARKEKIDERLSLMQTAGIKPVVMDVESEALIAAMSLLDPPEAAGKAADSIALLQLGRDASQFYVIINQALVFERELSLGSHKLDQEINRHPEQSQAATEAFHDVLCQELKRTVQLYQATSGNSEFAEILLAGPADKLQGLAQRIEQNLSLTVQLVNPFLNMEYSSAVDIKALHAEASSCLVACGLAMRREDT